MPATRYKARSDSIWYWFVKLWMLAVVILRGATAIRPNPYGGGNDRAQIWSALRTQPGSLRELECEYTTGITSTTTHKGVETGKEWWLVCGQELTEFDQSQMQAATVDALAALRGGDDDTFQQIVATLPLTKRRPFIRNCHKVVRQWGINHKLEFADQTEPKDELEILQTKPHFEIKRKPRRSDIEILVQQGYIETAIKALTQLMWPNNARTKPPHKDFVALASLHHIKAHHIDKSFTAANDR